jgi:hypothetical protein
MLSYMYIQLTRPLLFTLYLMTAMVHPPAEDPSSSNRATCKHVTTCQAE